MMPSLLRQVGDHMVSSVQRRINSGIGPRTLLDRSSEAWITNIRIGQLLSSIAARVSSTQVAVVQTVRRCDKSFRGDDNSQGEMAMDSASSRTRTFQRRYGFKVSVMAGVNQPDTAGFKAGRFFRCSSCEERRKPFALFILKKSVVIPPRPFMLIDSDDRATIMTLVRRHIGVSK